MAGAGSLRILWVSNAPWAGSGYGEQTNLFTQRFAAAGHDVAIVANHGLQERATNWHGIPVFPQSGEDSIQTFSKHWNADIVILLYDTWVMHPDHGPRSTWRCGLRSTTGPSRRKSCECSSTTGFGR